jgi:hypothetical protein
VTTSLSLYTLSSELQAVAYALAEDGLDQQTIQDTLESISGDFEDKAKAIVQMSRNFDGLIAQIKEAEVQMADRRKRLEARAKSMREYVMREMDATGISHIDCPLFAVSIVKNPPAVDIFDPLQVPDEFRVAPPPPPPEISRALIKSALAAGREVPGARLVQGKRLAIK